MRKLIDPRTLTKFMNCQVLFNVNFHTRARTRPEGTKDVKGHRHIKTSNNWGERREKIDDDLALGDASMHVELKSLLDNPERDYNNVQAGGQ